MLAVNVRVKAMSPVLTTVSHGTTAIACTARMIRSQSLWPRDQRMQYSLPRAASTCTYAMHAHYAHAYLHARKRLTGNRKPISSISSRSFISHVNNVVKISIMSNSRVSSDARVYDLTMNCDHDHVFFESSAWPESGAASTSTSAKAT